ncbi:hypothetical protein LBMAG47_21880 [Planctomycetia bacterium]|nr:hypothetical protein LBMAG47_21880 [Planctomycetia bacterium]
MKITVAIPTIAGRTNYLQSCLKTCVEQDYQDLEILVSDNSPGAAEATVAAFRDSRIRYIRPDRYLPMSRHWDFIIPYMTGELVTFIGDDDGLMPGAVREVAAIAARHGVQPIQHTIAHYCWPDVAEPDRRNTFWFHQPPSSEEKVISCDDFLSKLCRCEVRYIDGPMVYHNFVPRQLLVDLARDGFVFHRASPDVYTAVTVALNTPTFISTGSVLTVAGEGAKSNGAQSREGGEDAARFLKDMVAIDERPHCPLHTVGLATLDSIHEAALRYDRPDLRARIRLPAFYASALNECRGVHNPTMRRTRLRGVFAEAMSQGDFVGVLFEIGRRTLRTVLRSVSKAASDNGPWQKPRSCSEEVHDVSSAATFAAEVLRSGEPRSSMHGIAGLPWR